MPKLFNAYTTFEVLVVIGIIVLITGMVVPMSLRQTKLNELSTSGKDLHSHIFLQQQNAFYGKNSLDHGVYIESQGYWLFEGESFENSVTKDYFSLGKGINVISGEEEILFSQGSQRLGGLFSIVLTFDGRNYQILINREGVIDSYVLE